MIKSKDWREALKHNEIILDSTGFVSSKILSAADLSLLLNYNWDGRQARRPGNLEQIENMEENDWNLFI